MNICKVIGTPASTFKIKELEGSKLLVVLPLNPMNMRPEGTPYICEDRLGAGRGNVVLVSNSKRKASVIDASVVGILDSMEIENRVVFESE